MRELCNRYGILLVADEVISAFGRLGEWFGVQRYGGSPDLITLAKGLTSAYAPMGAVLVSERVTEPLYRKGVTLMHGVTFGGHPLSAAIALRNIEIFEREGVLENVRRLEPYLRRRLERDVLTLPIVGDVRGDGFFFAAELVRNEVRARFEPAVVSRLVRELLPQAVLDAGLIARADDRGDPVLQIAPPLISDERVLDEVVDAMASALEAASRQLAVEEPVRAA
jgi:adenosylmethionine-8-amino-7-oxononanoate aminotransferase